MAFAGFTLKVKEKGKKLEMVSSASDLKKQLRPILASLNQIDFV